MRKNHKQIKHPELRITVPGCEYAHDSNEGHPLVAHSIHVLAEAISRGAITEQQCAELSEELEGWLRRAHDPESKCKWCKEGVENEE